MTNPKFIDSYKLLDSNRKIQFKSLLSRHKTTFLDWYKARPKGYENFSAEDIAAKSIEMIDRKFKYFNYSI